MPEATLHWTIASRYEHLRPFLESIPRLFAEGQGVLIHDRRNQLRILENKGQKFVVKSFAFPSLPNRFIYAMLRQSKAERSFRYAQMLNSEGFGSPEPVAFAEQKSAGMWFGKSYYVSLLSSLPHTFLDVAHGRVTDKEVVEKYLEAVGHFTGRFHNAGMLHKDYNDGNLLLGIDQEGKAQVELIDLNRIRFHHVSLEEGCRNFTERINATPEQWQVMARCYARERGTDAGKCLELMLPGIEKSNKA